MTCEQHRRSLAADPEERTEALDRHLARCEACADFAEDAARLAGLCRTLPGPALPAGDHQRQQAPATGRRRWPLLALTAATLAALAALWSWRPVPTPSSPAPNLVLAARDASPATAAQKPVDLLAAISDARAVWSGGAAATWSPWPVYRGTDPVEGLDPVSDIFSSGLLAEAIGDARPGAPEPY